MVYRIIEEFTQKGFTSPSKAIKVEELNLPVKFRQVMRTTIINGRLDRLGVFLEVNGKYYLSEERLKEVSSAHAKDKRKQKAIRLTRERNNIES